MTTILEPQATVRYVSLTGYAAATMSDRGRCTFCGLKREGDPCFCRFCDSCTQYWIADTLHDSDDGRPHREYCGLCLAPTVAIIATCSLCDSKLSALIPAWAAEDTGDTDAQKLIEDLIGDAKWDRKDIGLVCRGCLDSE